MSLVNLNKWLRSLLVATLALALSIVGVLFAAPAQAAVTSADVFVLCGDAQDGSATLYVQNVMPVGQEYDIVIQYDDGVNRVVFTNAGEDSVTPLFGPYGQPLGDEGDGVDSATIVLVSDNTVESNHTTFNRDPQCGVRPNRLPIASDLATSGSRYDESIVVPVTGTSDPDGDSLTYSLASAPSNGSAVIQPVDDAQRGQYPDAQMLVVYTPNGVYLGDEVMTYEVNDGRGGTATGTITVTVNDSTPINAVAPTFVQPSRQHPSGQINIPTVEGIRYSFESDVLSEYEASGLYSLPQGTLVTVRAHATQPETTVVGTKSWQHTFTYLLRVANKNQFGTDFVNKVRVSNPNTFGVWFRYGDFTAPRMHQDGRVWVGAKSARFVGTSRKVLDWSATGSSGWSDAHRLSTTQIRPKGRIVIDCRGSRKLVKFYLNNTASTKRVRFVYHERRNLHVPRSVAAGTRVVVRYSYWGARPGWLYRITAQVPWGDGDILLARVRMPRSCR